MDKVKTPFLLYDANCALCTRFKQAIERLDFEHRIQYIPVGTAQVYQDFPEIDLEQSKQVLHYVNSEGAIYRGGEIAPELAKQFPAVNKLAWLLETDVGKKASNYFYDKIKELRNNSLITRACGGGCGDKH